MTEPHDEPDDERTEEPNAPSSGHSVVASESAPIEVSEPTEPAAPTEPLDEMAASIGPTEPPEHPPADTFAAGAAAGSRVRFESSVGEVDAARADDDQRDGHDSHHAHDDDQAAEYVEVPLPRAPATPDEDHHDTSPSRHETESIDDEALAGDDSELRPGLEKAHPFVLGLAPLRSAIESLIFVSDKPLTDKQLADLAHASVHEVRMAAFELQREYEGRGIELHLVAGGYQFRSAAKNSPFVRVLVAPKPVRLSRALLETLSIVAYRQPVTRPEIDDVRGVDSGEALKALADRDLIRILGRKEEPGRPLLYGTTKHFLEFFGMNSLRDLPTLREYAELTDESRSIFERRMGEPLDLKSAQAQADESLAKAHAEMLDRNDPDPDDDLDDDDSHAEQAEQAERAEDADAHSAEATENPSASEPGADRSGRRDDHDDDEAPSHEPDSREPGEPSEDEE